MQLDCSTLLYFEHTVSFLLKRRFFDYGSQVRVLGMAGIVIEANFLLRRKSRARSALLPTSACPILSAQQQTGTWRKDGCTVRRGISWPPPYLRMPWFRMVPLSQDAFVGLFRIRGST